MRLELAKRTDLALRAMQELCSCGDRLSGSELAETLETTHQYLPQIMSPLVRCRWVSSSGPIRWRYFDSRSLTGTWGRAMRNAIYFVNPANFLDLPIWCFHGVMDSVVPVNDSAKMVRMLRGAGCNVRFTTYANADHDSWTETYTNPELYEWLLSHRRV